jgi:LacI family transcriptional regulator
MATGRNGARVTIIDVAREANVSFSTVSRVVNGKGYISAETRRRVMEAMARTGYTVNRQARALAGGRHQVVGLLVPNLDTSYIGEILRGIDEELAAASWDLMLYTTHRQKSRESVFVSSLTHGMTDGLLMILPTDPASYIDSIRLRKFPYVLIDYGAQGQTGPSVRTTNVQGAFDATTYLIELGHRRIGFITGNLEMGCSHDRIAGHRDALAQAGIPFDEALIREGNFHQPQGYAMTQELLALEDRPTAIFASNDQSAFGVMDAVRDAGLRIPADVSVVGFDDIPGSRMTHPPLTTVRQPLTEIGRVATRMLLDLIADPDRPEESIDLPTELVIRESCQPPARNCT